MTQPEGFIEKGKENLVCKLDKAIYGLKQTSKCWNSSLDDYLKSLKFQLSSSDSCIYTRVSNDILRIIAVCVNDIIIACKSPDYLTEIETALSNKYKMKDLGKLHFFLVVILFKVVIKFLLIRVLILKCCLRNLVLKSQSLCLPLLKLIVHLKRIQMILSYSVVKLINLL